MTRTHLYAGAARWALFVALAATPLAGCKPAASPDQAAAPSDAIPLASGPAAAIAAAPAASALPTAPPVPVGRLANRSDRYAFSDRAYAMNRAFADAPPDYGFDYEGTQPWVWRSDSGAMRVAEPLPDGGDRYYYYQPGADYPYLVRDPQYSYGYESGQLVVIYDRSGRPLDDSQFDSRRDYASRYFYRGRTLYSASRQQRQAVAQDNWVARRRAYEAEQSRWAADQQNDADWRDYHQAHEDQYRDQWSAERARRANEGAQFAVVINDTQAADRDRKIAQQAQAHAGRQQQQGPSIFGVHLGGGSPPPKPAPLLAPAGPTTPPPPASNPTTPSPPAGQPAAPGAPVGEGGRHDHGHAPGGAPGAPGPTTATGTPAGPGRHEPPHEPPLTPAPPTVAAPPKTTVFVPPKPQPNTYPGQLPGIHGGAAPPPGMVRPSPSMRPLDHAPTTEPKPSVESKPTSIKPAEPRSPFVKPVEPKPPVVTPMAPRGPFVRPAEPATVVVKPAPPKPAGEVPPGLKQKLVKPNADETTPPKHARDKDNPDKP